MVRKNAYRYLLYEGMLDIRPIAWRRLRNPLKWHSELRGVRRAGALADWFHNLAVFSSLDFEKFDEEWFWKDGRSIEERHPGLGVERYQRVFEQRLNARSNTSEMSSAPNLIVRLDCSRITDWTSFHSVFAEAFGFPAFYGNNMNAWIDCMSYLDVLDAGMTKVCTSANGFVTLHLEGADEFAARCPEQYSALIECAAIVNWRRSWQGEPALLALAFRRQ